LATDSKAAWRSDLRSTNRNSRRNLKYIEIGKNEGAKLLCGGNRLTGGAYDKGFFVEPTIFGGVTPAMRIAQEEVFGPVLALMVADDFEDAMRLANGVRFGLSAAIISNDISRVHQFVNRIERSHHRQPADRGRRVSAAVRRHEGVELRHARAGTARPRFLHREPNGLHEAHRSEFKIHQTRIPDHDRTRVFPRNSMSVKRT
jgi:hypothetical protein